ncbi:MULTISPECIES: hypothetical protein [unclassified Chryseobacterium]|uniref:hypothetical protein n=1 Tax=unclassified Chryseobacterium TaxID=2593645 RepID=UPI00100BBE91|nr:MULTISPECIES: hypothetical protein [unclassified Chryseobacterium]RXM53226.1 hypothetical protein BOQ64_02260 [Chryseobacterium sp. CH25]RXM65578.1 hypothetical protein BOQ60_07235 [Chryseobacterium sp. CH1]
MKKVLFIYCYLSFTEILSGQVGVGTTQPDPSAVLDIVSSNKGLRLPVVNLVSTEDQSTISSPVKGFIVYNQTENGSGNTRVTKGLYSFDGTQWNKLLSHQNTEDRILEIPFLAPMFVASNIVTGAPASQTAGSTVTLTFNKLDYNFQNGATGTAPNYGGYTIQEDGVYSISFAADIRNTTGDTNGEQVIFVRRNGANICAYGMQRKFQFGGISNDCTYSLSTGDVISFTARSTGAAYQIYNTNVSIYQSH